MTRLLWVTDEPPDRGRGGGSIRQSQLLTRLSDEFEITLLTTSAINDAEVRARAGRIVEVTSRPLRQRRLAGVVSRFPADVAATGPVRAALSGPARELEGDSDLVMVEHAWLLPILPSRRAVPWIGTLHYLPSRRAAHWMAVARDPVRRVLRRWDQLRARRLEQWAVREYDRIITVSPADAAELGDCAVVPNGVDLDAFSPSRLPSSPRILVTASLNYTPNDDGLRWFVDKVLPIIHRHRPDAILDVVGRRPSPELRSYLDRPGVNLHSDVPEVASFLETARVAVVPLRVGSGTRVKALEAMASGRPVVGTSIGLEGLGLTDGLDCRVADEPEALAEAILDTLVDDARATDIAVRGHARARDSFGWDQLADRLAAELRAVLASTR